MAAARRAGFTLTMFPPWAFALCPLTAGIGGLLSASYLGGMSNNVTAGQLVLYAVGAAVIGEAGDAGRGDRAPAEAEESRDPARAGWLGLRRDKRTALGAPLPG